MLRLAAFFYRAFFVPRSRLLAENLALRQQLAMLHRQSKRPRVKSRDRWFWIFMVRLFRDWRSWLVVVKPDTVIRWHRAGFRGYWRWKSRPKKRGRPAITNEIAELIRRLAEENPLWGAPRVHGELMKLGFEVAERTVGRYLKRIRRTRPTSQSWMTFLRNHMGCTAACDFFVVPTITFRLLYCSRSSPSLGDRRVPVRTPDQSCSSSGSSRQGLRRLRHRRAPGNPGSGFDQAQSSEHRPSARKNLPREARTASKLTVRQMPNQSVVDEEPASARMDGC